MVRSMVRWWIAALIVPTATAPLASCTQPAAFECTIDGQCDRDIEGAMCQMTGYCSFPDAMCASEQRYGELAGGGLSGECVPDHGGTTTPADSTPPVSTTTPASGEDDGTTMNDPGQLDLPRECGAPGLPCCDGQCEAGSMCRGDRCEPCTIELDADGYYSCAARSDGVTACWGSDEFGQLGDGVTEHPTGSAEPVTLNAALDALDLGATHGCGIGPDGLLCWGRNTGGQLGLGRTFSQQPSPAVVDLAAVVEVAGGSEHTCARTEDARVWCWGRNQSGETGTEPGMGPVTSPVMLPDLEGITDVATARSSTCVVDDAGGVTCWGRNDRLQLGRDAEIPLGEPVVVADVPPARAITAGDFHYCIITANTDEVWCWGANERGQTGDGAVGMMNEALPHPVLGLSEVEHIDAGDDHVCVVAAEGAACWGSNDHGQLGHSDEPSTPTPRWLDLDDIAQIRCGHGHTCAVSNDSRVYCFGLNDQGQLGDGTFTGGPTPVPSMFGCGS